MSKTYKHLCTSCGDDVAAGRWNAGFHLCLLCGEERAKQRRFTVVPMHKSNYIACFNRDDLIGINNKGGLVK
jgi:predicted RNA-binding Zn-ribbon protein involved in translation (DUF1610 family)